MGNTKMFVLSGASREQLTEGFFADIFRTHVDRVALKIRRSEAGSWHFLAAVRSDAMSAFEGVSFLRFECFDLSATMHDIDMPAVFYDQIDPAEWASREYRPAFTQVAAPSPPGDDYYANDDT